MKGINLKEILIWVFVIVFMMVGGFIGLYVTGNFEKDLVMAIVIGSILAFLVNLFLSIRRKKKNGNVPPADERTLLLMQRYFMGVLYVVLIGSGALLLVLYAMGIESIQIEMIIVYLAALFILIGCGTLIVKRL